MVASAGTTPPCWVEPFRLRLPVALGEHVFAATTATAAATAARMPIRQVMADLRAYLQDQPP